MAKDKSASQKRFWVVAHHNEITIEESSERPSVKVAAGERMKRVRGPFATKDEASKVRDDTAGRTLRVQAGR